MQRLPLYSGHSINQPWNKTWTWHTKSNCKEKEGGYSNYKRREKVGFLLLLAVTPVAKLIEKYSVLCCNNPIQSISWLSCLSSHQPNHSHLTLCTLCIWSRLAIQIFVFLELIVSWIHKQGRDRAVALTPPVGTVKWHKMINYNICITKYAVTKLTWILILCNLQGEQLG